MMNTKEIKIFVACEMLSRTMRDTEFTRSMYNRVAKDNSFLPMPKLDYLRRNGLVKVTETRYFTIKRGDETINAKRYVYTLDKDAYKEAVSFLGSRSGMKSCMSICARRLRENTAQIQTLTKRNATLEACISLMGSF